MIKWTVIKGIGTRNRITIRTTSGAPVPLSGQESFNCRYWAGEDAAAAGTLEWAYHDTAAGEVDVTISAAIAGALDPGIYQWVLELPDGSAAYARGSFEITAGPGAMTFTVAPYCSYSDLLDYCPWVRQIASTETDTAGFLDKRVLARQWFDNVIVSNYRGQSATGFTGSYAAFTRGWRRRSLLPNRWLSDQLAAGNLIVDAQVRRINAYKAASFVGLGQVGINNAFAQLGQLFDDRAEAECLAQTCLIDTDADGVGDVPIPLGSTNTLFT